MVNTDVPDPLCCSCAVHCHIALLSCGAVGNPHQLGAKPLTFTRQVIALTAYPALLDHPKASEMFAPDAIKRARELNKAFNGGVGAYQVCACGCVVFDMLWVSLAQLADAS